MRVSRSDAAGARVFKQLVVEIKCLVKNLNGSAFVEEFLDYHGFVFKLFVIFKKAEHLRYGVVWQF